MNRLFTTALSALSVLAIVSPSFAADFRPNTTRIDHLNHKLMAFKNDSVTTKQTSPANLVGIGYQGFLEGQGIPSGGAFLNSVNRGDITPETLVQSGIDNGRLSPETLNNQGYLNAVQTQLDSLNRS